jgi:WD40 repeat protein
VQFSVDNSQVWTLAYDNLIRVWDVATGEVIAEIPITPGGMTAIGFNPDGTLLAASGMSDHIIHFWDTTTWQETMRWQDDRVNQTLAFSPDGAWLATGGEGDFSVHVWNLSKDDKTVTPLEFHTATVNSLTFSTDGKYLASGSSDETVRVWDMTTGKEVYTISGFNALVESVTFTTDDTTLLVGTYDNQVRFYNVSSGEQVGDFTADVDGLTSLIINNDTSQMGLVGSFTWRVQSLTTAQPLDPLTGYVSLSGKHGVFNPETSLFAFYVDDINNKTDAIVLFDLRDNPGAQVGGLNGSSIPNALVFSPDGTLLAAAGRDGQVEIWGIEEE